MNRNAEWDAFVNEVKNAAQPEFTLSADNAAARVFPRGMRLPMPLVAIPVTGVCVALLTLTALCNTSKTFARTANAHPALRGLARLLTANPSLRAITAPSQ
jgi:hypothetical protein